MENAMQVFENPEFGEVRVTEIEGEPWWVLSDVCKVLELSNPSMIANRLDDDEKQHLEFNPNFDLGLGHNGATIISEPGLYKVVLRSNKPKAEPFMRWITHEVVPSIRKHGGYIAGQETMTDDELIARALVVAKSKLKAHGRVSNNAKRFPGGVDYIDMIERIHETDTLMQCKLCCTAGMRINV